MATTAPTPTTHTPDAPLQKNGELYITCPSCSGTGAAQLDGDPFCTECFGGGLAILDLSSARTEWLRQAGDAPQAGRIDKRTGSGTGRGSADKANRYPGSCVKCSAHVAAGEGLLVRDAQRWAVQHRTCPEAATAAPAAPAPVRANRYPGACTTCGQNVPAQAGELYRNGTEWAVRHTGTCPEQPTVAQDATSYEPQRGDVHVVEGDYYRVHIAQRSGRAYVVRCVVHCQAEYDQDGKLAAPGEWDWDRVPGMLRNLGESTKATAAQAATLGQLVGRCVYCSHAIDTPESTAAGYGPSCAQKYGLPWG